MTGSICFVNIIEAILKLNNKGMIRLSLSREVEGKRPDEARQPAKKFLFAMVPTPSESLKNYILDFLRDEDKTFLKSFASSFQKGLLNFLDLKCFVIIIL